jgi:hypothetical protein
VVVSERLLVTAISIDRRNPKQPLVTPNKGGDSMKLLAILILSTSLCVPALADSPPREPYEIWIQTILEEYSERTGARFVLDPRVNMKVQLVGFEADDIDYPTLSRILLMHGYRAVEIDGITYILVDSVTDEFVDKLKEKIDTAELIGTG